MKKSLLVGLILLSGVLLTACGKKDQEDTEILANPAVTEECKKAIEEYLEWTDKKWNWDAIAAWDNIIVDYIWRLENGTVFDTSVKSVAEACGTYNESRDYTEGLSFEAWAGQMVKWFDNGVIGMKLWQTKTVQFGPEEWYWEYDENLVVDAPISELWDVSQLSEWDTVTLWIWYPAKITKITDKTVTFDLNSELAGKSLIFDITIKSITPKSETSSEQIVSEIEG